MTLSQICTNFNKYLFFKCTQKIFEILPYPITRLNKLNERKIEKERLLIEFKEYLFDIKNMNTYHQKENINHTNFIRKTIKEIETKLNILKNNWKVKNIDLMEIEMILKEIEVTKNKEPVDLNIFFSNESYLYN